MLKKTGFYIGGRWVAPAASRVAEVVNPADEKPFAEVSMGSTQDVDAAVAAARAAFPAWSATSRKERLGLLEALLGAYERRVDEMAATISSEMGAPIQLARDGQAASGAVHIRNTIKVLAEYVFEEPFEGRAGERIVREPIGVCGLVTPWNWPMNQIAVKAVPALAAGCTVVLKPSEAAPLSAMLFAEIVHEAGFPAGTFNLVNGTGEEAGAALAAHPGVDMVSLTGSTRAGVAVSRAAAGTVKRVALELGGKSPNVVFADSGLEAAVERGVRHCFLNGGQSCNAPSRMIVERQAYGRAVEIAAECAASVKVGRPGEDGGHIGPLASKAQFDRVQKYIGAGIAEGARLAAGGMGRPEGFPRGYYVRPTVFSGVTNRMRIAREEIFGPVMVMIPFDTEEQAVAIANDTPYGLAAFVQSGDVGRAERVARAIRAGNVQINGTFLPFSVPFGGYKQSGLGREGGVFGFEEFLEVKAISGMPEGRRAEAAA